MKHHRWLPATCGPSLLDCEAKIDVSVNLEHLSAEPQFDPPVRGRGRGHRGQSAERLCSTGLCDQEHPPNLGGPPTRWLLQTQTLLHSSPKLHSQADSNPKLGLRHNSKSRLDTSGAPIKPHIQTHDRKKHRRHLTRRDVETVRAQIVFGKQSF